MIINLLPIVHVLFDAIRNTVILIYPIIKTAVGCLLGIIIWKVIEDSVDKKVSIFSTDKDTKLFFLSRIYTIGRDMRLAGKTDKEIQEELLEKYKSKTLPFMFFPVTTPKTIEALEFVGKVLEDKESLFTYVISPSFGKKAYKDLLSVFTDDKKNREAKYSISECLIDNAPDKVDECFQWLPELFYVPYIENENNNIKKQQHTASIYYYLVDNSDKGDDDNNIAYFKKGVNIRQFICMLKKLKEIYPNMEFSPSTSISSLVPNNDARRKRIYEFIKAEEEKIRRK